MKKSFAWWVLTNMMLIIVFYAGGFFFSNDPAYTALARAPFALTFSGWLSVIIIADHIGKWREWHGKKRPRPRAPGIVIPALLVIICGYTSMVFIVPAVVVLMTTHR